jgi:hypothetical protein
MPWRTIDNTSSSLGCAVVYPISSRILLFGCQITTSLVEHEFDLTLRGSCRSIFSKLQPKWTKLKVDIEEFREKTRYSSSLLCPCIPTKRSSNSSDDCHIKKKEWVLLTTTTQQSDFQVQFHQSTDSIFRLHKHMSFPHSSFQK